MIMDVRIRIVAAAGVLLAVAGCVEVPETGRTRLALVSDSMAMEMGLSEFEKMKAEASISNDKRLNEMVRRVGLRIAEVVSDDMPNAEWEFVVFDNEQPNAFALPGGKVGVFSGIMQIAQDENGLATVIGHEVAHAVAGHGAERASEALAMQLGGQLLGAAMGDQSGQTRAMVSQAYGLGTQLGRALPHGRQQESEADYMGLIYMARAGYDPAQAISFWERFAAYGAQQGSEPVWFLSTHPVKSQRIAQIRDWLPEAQAEYRAR